MRYWGFFAAKLAVAGGVMYGLLRFLNTYFGPQVYATDPVLAIGDRASQDLRYTILFGIWMLATCGIFFLCVRDQRYRCRVCLRRLRMPVEHGSWGRMLHLGRPQVEYICPYGHGTLNLEKLQITGLDNPQWRKNAGFWEELTAASKQDDQEKP